MVQELSKGAELVCIVGGSRSPTCGVAEDGKPFGVFLEELVEEMRLRNMKVPPIIRTSRDPETREVLIDKVLESLKPVVEKA